VHHHVALAAEGLERIESELGRAIDQIFSVGDMGLFLDESDWEFLTGPKKYRCPEESPKIREAWQAWRWPLSMIAGNHEPFHRLRDWQPDHFLHKLEFTNAGEMEHEISGLRVAGLSGIYHPQELQFLTPLERRTIKLPPVETWADMVPLVQSGKISRSRLTYYKAHEIELMKRLDFRPHLLLLHDWPVAPGHIRHVYDRRPEAEIATACKAPFVCCGHHHTAADFRFQDSRILPLNIISTAELLHRHIINPGWCAIFTASGDSFEFLQTWPEK
jgi:hypothetical protein